MEACQSAFRSWLRLRKRERRRWTGSFRLSELSARAVTCGSDTRQLRLARSLRCAGTVSSAGRRHSMGKIWLRGLDGASHMRVRDVRNSAYRDGFGRRFLLLAYRFTGRICARSSNVGPGGRSGGGIGGGGRSSGRKTGIRMGANRSSPTSKVIVGTCFLCLFLLIVYI